MHIKTLRVDNTGHNRPRNFEAVKMRVRKGLEYLTSYLGIRNSITFHTGKSLRTYIKGKNWQTVKFVLGTYHLAESDVKDNMLKINVYGSHPVVFIAN
jgi:hypothetical protein